MILDADLTMPPEQLQKILGRDSLAKRRVHQWQPSDLPDGTPGYAVSQPHRQ
jgi:hypothetical protein